MKAVAIACLALLSVSVLTFNMAIEQNSNDDKVKVNFYYESLCPYCQQFMSSSLTKAMATDVPLL